MTMCAKEEDKILEILDNGAKQAELEAQETLVQLKELMKILRKR